MFFSFMNSSKRVMRTWKVMKEVVVQCLTEPMKMLKRFEIWGIHSTKLIMWKYWSDCMKMCIERGLNFGPVGFYTIMMLQFIRCSLSSSFWPKSWLVKWNTHSFPLICLWMTGCFQNKVCVKGTKISGHWRHPQKMWEWHWKLFHNRNSENVSSSGSNVGLSA
jgi:hypothetical protein